jgi:hypothetical protein
MSTVRYYTAEAAEQGSKDSVRIITNMSTNNSLLPKEAVALVQHIELNKAGWWDKAVHRLVLAAVWLADEPPSADAIQAALLGTFKLPISTAKLLTALGSLESRKMLLRLPTDAYKIPEEQSIIFEKEIDASEKIESAAKETFCKMVAEIGEELEPAKVWESFEHQFLGPLIKQVGANAYRLVAGERMTVDSALVDYFLMPFPSGVHGKLRALVTAFIDPKKPEVCAYISRMLHARFCVEASGLPEDVLAKLNASVGKQIRFRMFVDTNFLFSLLEIHENPSNAAAQELRELIAQLNGNPRIELFVTPETIEEAKGSIAHTKGLLSGLPAGSNFTQIALGHVFSGMAVKFLTERLRKNGKLTTEDWFDPYLYDFVPIARGKGVELFNEKLDGYSTRQDVVDDINILIEFETRRLPEHKRKSYPKIAHDMMLWHFVNDKRPAYVESPTDADSWILTVDFRFIAFDEHKQNHSKSKIPLCIHPTSLIQLLQFWIPRTKAFEEAVLGSLRLPFLFQDFDAEGEQTSLKILKGIGRFEGNEGLSQDAITQVMLNEGLRSRLRAGETDEVEVALIRDALVEEMRQRAEAEATKTKTLHEEILKRESEIAALAEHNKLIAEESTQTKKQKEEAEAAAREAVASQGAQIEELRSKVLAMTDSEAARSKSEQLRRAAEDRNKALLQYCGMLLAIFAASMLAAWLLTSRVPQLASLIGKNSTRGFIGVVTFIVCHLALELSVGRKKSMSSLWPFQRVVRLRGWLWSLVILGFVLGVIGNLVANRIQQNLDEQNAPKSILPPVAQPK